MLGALAGGEALEILVILKDLSGAGFKKVQAELVATETAAGKTGKGLGATGGALTALGGPLVIAAGGFAAVAGAGIAAVDTYQQVHKQLELLDEALAAHGHSLAEIRTALDVAVEGATAYGFTADDTRAAVTRLVQAGVDTDTIFKQLPAVFDLANAKQLSAADAADLLAKATVGSVKGLTDLGIKLPAVTGGLAGIAKAQKEVNTDTTALSKAQTHLSDVEHSLAGKHKLTAAEALRLRDAHQKVDDATTKLKAAQDKLKAAQDLGTSAAKNFTTAALAVKGATGDTSSSVDSLKVAQTKLSDKWEEFSTKVGPGLMAIFGHIIDAMTTILGLVGDAIDALSKAMGMASGPQFDSSGHATHGRPITLISGSGSTTSSTGASPQTSSNHFARGGYVPARPGGTDVNVGEAGEGEWIIPESRIGSSRGGHSHPINLILTIDGDDLAYRLERKFGAVFALRGTSARLGSGA